MKHARQEFSPDLMSLDATSPRRILDIFREKTSSQRSDLYAHQLANLVLLANPEVPDVDSTMNPDMMEHNSCIQKLTGTVKLLHKLTYQFRKIYIYQVDGGMIDVLDTYGFIDNNGYATPFRTDLDLLKEGDEITIGNKKNDDDFYLKYVHQFDPATRSFSLGANVRCAVSLRLANAADSVCVSQSFINRFISFKTKKLSLKLNRKTVLTMYDGNLPPLGEMISGNILAKIVQDISETTALCQSIEIPSGDEDDTIFTEPNSYISAIEVYSNQPLQNELLEKYRLELLEFRTNVRQALSKYSEKMLSKEAKILKENFSHQQFRDTNTAIDFPLLQLTINTIDVPEEGTKVTNRHGAKTTIQSIYPDHAVVDQYGRGIEIEFPTCSIINRGIPGILYEIFYGGIVDLLDMRIHRKEITPKKTYEFVTKLFKLIGLENEFTYANMSEEELFEYLQTNRLKIIIRPFTSGIDVETSRQVLELAKKYIGFDLMTVRTFDKDGKYNKRTDKHLIGTIYTVRDMHDTYQGNSSASIPMLDLKGLPVDKDPSKKEGRSLYQKQSAKLDVLTNAFIVLMATHRTANTIINQNKENHHMIKEFINSIGFDFVFGSNVGGNEEL